MSWFWDRTATESSTGASFCSEKHSNLANRQTNSSAQTLSSRPTIELASRTLSKIDVKALGVIYRPIIKCIIHRRINYSKYALRGKDEERNLFIIIKFCSKVLRLERTKLRHTKMKKKHGKCMHRNVFYFVKRMKICEKLAFRRWKMFAHNFVSFSSLPRQEKEVSAHSELFTVEGGSFPTRFSVR